MGYDQSTLRNGFTAAGASFLGVSDRTIKLSDLTVIGYGDEGYAGNMIVAQTLTANGKTNAKYYWVDYSEDGDSWYGWYNSDWDKCYNGETLNPGDGLWIQSPSEGISLQNAGAVSATDIAVTLVSDGFKLVVNPMPATTTLENVTVSGYGEVYADNMIVAQTLTANGKTDAKYYWVDYSEEGDTWFGWYDIGWEKDCNKVDLAAGAGLWIQSPKAYTMSFKSPLSE